MLFTKKPTPLLGSSTLVSLLEIACEPPFSSSTHADALPLLEFDCMALAPLTACLERIIHIISRMELYKFLQLV